MPPVPNGWANYLIRHSNTELDARALVTSAKSNPPLKDQPSTREFMLINPLVFGKNK
jgi:hypothetical protein